ncbi:MAG: hypothetical protein E7016_05190 [Alphaproteobacteria bacterium]|nr:hypothetical protein [Alphaproteobacteria bacterium]
MTDMRKKLSKKISQGGSMMVEAMAMLALIALVTPTLYKKSAERTTELQDINTATHVRTLAKAVDNYVSANYQALLEENLSAADAVHEIDITSQELASFLPYGYSFDNLKNFGTPRVRLKRQGDSESITSFVQFPKKTEIGEMRASRIASMIGSNGGYITRNGDAKGVGGVWSLGSSEIGNLGLDTSKGSVVVASSEAINSATSGALENEKYLQRTAVEAESEKWRNSMSTDLYMGGVAGSTNMNSILGVKQMIIGATDGNDADLVLSDSSEKGGSAWFAGNFSALEDMFKLEQGADGYTMDFANAINAQTDMGNPRISFIGGNIEFDADAENGMATATFGANTTVNKTFEAKGDTSVATGPGSIFQAGADGKYITAEDNKLSLLSGNIITETNAAVKTTTIATDLVATNKTNLQGTTVIGSDENKVRPQFITESSARLNVQGNAFVRDTLEATNIKSADFDVLNLSAGGVAENSNRWLKANGDGVTIANINNVDDVRLKINNTDSTTLLGAGGLSKVELGDTEAIFQGGDTAVLYTENQNGIVTLQDGAIILSKKGNQGANNQNKITMQSADTDIQTNIFKIYNDNAGEVLTINTVAPDGVTTNLNSKNLTINNEVTEGEQGKLTITGNQLFQVLPDSVSTNTPTSNVEIDPSSFRVSSIDNYSGVPVNILAVDTEDIDGKIDGKLTDNGSVYIRRGAIELETPNLSVAQGARVADEGVGYIEASRFVSNAYDPISERDDSIAQPVFAGDYTSGLYGSGYNQYDRYMVNPAYTSVMHDIKLTTRGGARLSDILPDFINKGIYVVTNTYEDTININNIRVSTATGQVLPLGVNDISTSGTISGTKRWASPFLGVVPAPQCPPGHAKVVTITPAGFQMAQAGEFRYKDANNPFHGGGAEKRFVMEPGGGYENNLGTTTPIGENASVNYAEPLQSIIYDSDGNASDIYYLGYSLPLDDTTKCKGDMCRPKPLYFQQSTWLRSKTIPQATDYEGDCTNGGTRECGASFAGWSAVMGFVYPGKYYANIIDKLMGGTGNSGKADTNSYYWNVFPVQTGTLEGYATVYCYFDRSNIFGSGLDERYVDQYDQLNNFRGGYNKEGKTRDNSNMRPNSNNSIYLNRLNDPQLIYNEPW